VGNGHNTRTLTIEITGHDLTPLDNEAGGHRVQRIPKTEKGGRVHSSTVTVSVLGASDGTAKGHPAALQDPEHFELTWYSGSGAGGQHRNKHQNSARLKHLPTGTVVTAQCRKRPNSEAQARAEMADRLNAMLGNAGQAQLAAKRRSQTGTGAKADKRRTYRFQDGRVTDHVTGKSTKAKAVMAGKHDALWV